MHGFLTDAGLIFSHGEPVEDEKWFVEVEGKATSLVEGGFSTKEEAEMYMWKLQGKKPS